MSHALVLGLFDSAASAAAAARALHAAGIGRNELSIVSRSHQEEGTLANQMDGTPGADLEDSRGAARLGELGGVVLAAMAVVMPGIGPIVAAGPLAAGLGEAAGHLVGGVAPVLARAGVAEARAQALADAVHEGRVLLGVHVPESDAQHFRRIVEEAGATTIEIARWE